MINKYLYIYIYIYVNLYLNKVSGTARNTLFSEEHKYFNLYTNTK